MLHFDFSASSDRGLVRKNNEDSAYAGTHLLALADGMGGHAAGEVASQLMINSIKQLDGGVEKLSSFGADSILGLMADVAAQANKTIADGVRDNPETDGMGTTLTALLLHSTEDGTELGMCHVGDSRAYRLRNNSLEQITIDDTFVQSLVDEGKLDPSEVSTHPQRSLILKAYTGRPVTPTLKLIDVLEGDRFLICSDGLSDPVSFSTIEETLRKGTPEQAVKQLISLALRSGGPDNVTVVVADVKSGSTDAQPQEVGALNADQAEDPRPDTAAGRAAMMQIRSSVAARSPQAVIPKEEVQEEEKKPKNRILKIILSLIILILLLIVGSIPLTAHFARNTYFLSAIDGRITIMQGWDRSIFSHSLYTPYQQACLSAEGDIKITDSLSPEPDCDPFMLSDLPQNIAQSLNSHISYDYDGVVDQLRTLGQEALPLCVIRESNPNAETSSSETSPSTEASSTGASPSTTAAPTTVAAPNMSEQNADENLMSPGISCRPLHDLRTLQEATN